MEYTIIRSRRKTVGITISREGLVVVRAPEFLSRRDIDRFVREKDAWIRRHLQQVQALHPEPISASGLEALAREALADLPARAQRYAPIVGVHYEKITIRAQRSRWGSCSSKGSLNFNCLLMLAPPEVRDYVVIHELCHRLEMNHSPAFWAQVKRVCPEYENHKKWLKENGAALIGRLP